MMNIEVMKDQAIERMHLLELDENIIAEFVHSEKLACSNEFGSWAWLNKSEQEMIREFSIKTDSFVYHVIKTPTAIGLLYSILYVSTSEEEWEMDIEDIENGQVFAYVVNKDNSECSEFGTIGIEKNDGVLVRVS